MNRQSRGRSGFTLVELLVVIAITTVKIAGSLVAPHVTDNPELVAGYLGAANGLGFLAGAMLNGLIIGAWKLIPGRRYGFGRRSGVRIAASSS